MGKHTPGPWQWFGDTKHGAPYLATVHGGRRYVMDFVRKGMNRAQPRFQIDGIMEPASDLAIYEVAPLATSADDTALYRHDIIGIRHPDAQLIAAAPDLLEALQLLHDNIAEYARINHLGGFDNQDMRMARAALAKATRSK